MSENLFERNLGALAACSPRFWEDVASGTEDLPRVALRLFPSASGSPALEASREGARCLIHSARDPAGEAERFVDPCLDGSEEIVVVFGFGLGYHVEAVLAGNRGCKVLVVEPCRSILRCALAARVLSPILESGRVVVMPFSEDWTTRGEAAALASLAGSKLLVHRPYRVLFPSEAGAVESGFGALQTAKEINRATLKRFDRLWTKNTFKNAPYFFSLGGIGDFRGSLEGLPAVVVSAGPSVEEDLGSLREIADRAVVIAVDSALRPLLRRGIAPDFAVTVDPQLVNSLSVGDLGPAPAGRLPVLVADPAVYPVTLRTYRGPVILTSSVFSPGKVIESYSGAKGSIAAGGSVSVAAFDLARVLGAGPVILLGLDLSYARAKSHLSGSFIEAYVQSKITRLRPAASLYLSPVMSGGPLFVRDRAGNAVLTDRRMLLYRSWFERHAGESPAGTRATQVYNATPRGLGIPGVTDRPLSELARSMGGAASSGAGSKAARVAGLRARMEEKKHDRAGADGFFAFLDLAVQNLARVRALAARARDASRSLLTGTRDPAGGEAELGALDEEILSYGEEQKLLSMVMQGSIQRAGGIPGRTDDASRLDDRERGDLGSDRREAAYRGSLELYTALEEGAGFLSLVLAGAQKKLRKYLEQADI